MTQSNGNSSRAGDDDNGPDGRVVAYTGPEKPSFFTIYKKGQGNYTRYGTALGAAILVIVIALFVYEQSYVLLANSFYHPQPLPTDLTTPAGKAVVAANDAALTHAVQLRKYVASAITAALALASALVAWRVMNAPKSADFLISTDSEMKKVSWPTRDELIGSTRIVILFLFIIALLLFLIDVGAGAFFQLIGLLKFGILG